MKTNTVRRDKRGRILRSAEERQSLIAAFQQSDLGMAEFCRRRDIQLSTFCAWVHRAKRKRGLSEKTRAPVHFAEVQVAMGGTVPIEVEMPGGVRIRIRDAGFWPMVGGWLREAVSC